MFKRQKYDLPKFESPQAEGIVARPRLFELFSANNDKRIIWLSAPAGSGKTSLITSYLSTRDKKLIWYQVDAGDGDIASFFHHMGLCIKKAYPKKRGALPDFTSEYLAGLSAFSVNYFRELFHKVEPDSVIVLDNYQDAGEDVPLHEVIQAASSEVPHNVQLILISRQDPPTALARLRTSPTFSLIDLSEIKFNRVESDDVVRDKSNASLNESQLQKLHELTHGWAAGLVLTLEYLKTDPEFLNHFNFQDQNALFDYLTNEIFNDFNESTQQALMKTSFLQRISVKAAKKLTNEPKIKNILSFLAQHQLLTIKHHKISDSFEYHPLFREFLNNRAIASYTSQELTGLHNKTAELELKAGNINAAALQYINIENWPELSTLIESHAQSLTHQGLHLTVERWVHAIPDEFVNQHPWLVFWRAYCRAQYDPGNARVLLEMALELFQEYKDARGVYLCWCHLVESYVQNWDDFVPLVDLVKRYEEIQKQFPTIPGIEIKARVTIGMFAAMVYAWPDHPDFDKWLKKINNLFRFLPVKQVRAMIGAVLGMYYNMKGNLHGYRALNDVMRAILASEDISPLFKLFALANIGSRHLCTGDLDALEDVCRQAFALADQTGVMILNRMFKGHLINSCLIKGDARRAYDLLDEAQNEEKSHTSVHYGYLLVLRARADILKGDYSSAYSNAKASLNNKSYAGFIFAVPVAKATMGLSKVLQGDIDGGREELIAACNAVAFFESDFFDFSLFAYVAWFDLLKGDEKSANDYLAKSFSSAAKAGIHSTMLWYGPMMQDLSLRALEQDIEPAFTRELIRRNHLTPPDNHPFAEHWPWPLKIYTLGRFSIVLNDQPIDTKSRSIDLLKVLLAYGGRDVHIDKITDALWPEADGDQAQASFKTTLHRLRNEFTDLDVLVLKNHQLSLNEQYVWVDTWAMSRLFANADKSEHAENPSQRTELAKKLIQHYRGNFLASEPVGWVIQQREGLRIQFVRHTTALAQSFENEDSNTAIECYQRLLTIDPLIEEAYQGLIRCYQSQSRQAEAQSAYQQCVDVLKATSGVAPSANTTDLIRT